MTSSKIHNTSGRLWVEEGEHGVGPVAAVAPIAPIDREYSFRVPPELAGKVEPGRRVEVPLGRRDRITPAFCVALDTKAWDSTLKAIHAVIDAESFLTSELLELGRWMSRYYACPLGRTLAALVPEAVRRQTGFRTVERVSLADRQSSDANDPKNVCAKSYPSRDREGADFAVETAPLPYGRGSVEEPLPYGRGSDKTRQTPVKSSGRIGPKQRAVIEYLERTSGSADMERLLADTGASRATVRTLESKGWVTIEATREPPPFPDFDQPRDEPDFQLNADQTAAVSRLAEIIDRREFRVALLFGVSGSGKTEVYIHAMRRVLAQGRQVVMLVPEIALTTQLVHRLASRFERVAVIHSGLTGVKRSLTWTAIRAGEKRVIIGTRSAVFAPCPDLGLIVVDEEQETSYKNLQAPRFHVRDVAIKRAQARSIPVILGSATPSLETWLNCRRQPHYERIDLPRRVRDLPMPQPTIIDMHGEFHERTGFLLLSRVLLDGLRRTFDRREQAVVLLNRRGYAAWLACPACRHQICCPDCNINMVYHADGDEIICHHCSRRLPAPKDCPNPSCGAPLVRMGSGTERVAAAIQTAFPGVRLARADSDTMSHERLYRRLVEDFAAGRLDCMVGTQMIAKGLDFPNVSFVGVIAADPTHASWDFRTTERLFQLIMQVAGRAGRGSVPGEVVVQTMSPDSPAIRAAVSGDYASFADDELGIRVQTRMPPVTRIARIVFAHLHEPRARAAAEAFVTTTRELTAKNGMVSADVLGPFPCALTRLRKRYRYEAVLRADTAANMQQLLERLRAEKALTAKAATVMIDVDPVSFV